MLLGLKGQGAVVYGGARGIGHAIARELAVEEARVVIADCSPGTAESARALASTTGAFVEPLSVDVTDNAAVKRSADEAYELLGACDHVVFSAAVGSGQFGMPFWNVDPALWERVLKVNLIGAMHVARAYGPRMADRGGGSLLFLGSVAGQIGSPTDPPYSASKAGLINFTQCVARDLAPYGVRANIINPGMVRTELNHSVWSAWNEQQPDDQKRNFETWTAEKIDRMVPLKRWQEPEDIAAMAVFLASDRARNITGQTINVDGGFVMHW